MNYYIEVNGQPVCSSKLVLAASLAAADCGGGFEPRCGYESNELALLAGVEIRRVLGGSVTIHIGHGECPVAAAENAYDAKQTN